ncbi:MAG TPA: bacteriohopanetetrol glucosamine biosynthesis glycosyltransferase HpnI [Nitrospira sp.]|nr:bacteriohopanetetrol glucosamine biosynthesis glycosyltransferase HpnI [Nitrospira sp.]HNA25862.1 bacteriohopanetetrol glucosamine biosynthesis glycosyltransferase HpnI [Nitrospira sp.]HNI67372.1 bacteriohopanetetrol glucosamine biosynthesis glycosyltransferase HpnI [Nitrospira sp.]HNK13993.1 bacteriohopanetetrol glucosamine biosynthesis glycosyltransferase HpnI [Nitrospira sp.]HNL88518.1 bacteriohopanetetrol glucosamine biosynthesis glycosyltransferase HpnI [Nitrospira sp.]
MVFSLIQIVCLIPVVFGSIYGLLCLLALLQFRWNASYWVTRTFAQWPPVTILKPVCGLEKNLAENLRSTCRQDYPNFQVVFSVQRTDDPAISLLYALQKEFGSDRVTVAIETFNTGPNGKINNLIGGLKHALHGLLVISDSDIRLRPDYLKTIVAPLADPDVGFVCTLYKARDAGTWFEAMELLTINTDLTPNMAFALVTGAANFCLGASTALRRSTLEDIGGLPSLADYLVEDYEMGRRIWSKGQRMVILPYVVDTVVDLKTPMQWWNHLVYWDQNNRAARPGAVFSTVVIRSVPFACLFALLTLWSPIGIAVLVAAVLLRVVVAGCIMRWGLDDREGLRWLWLVPIRDIAALGSWMLAFTKRTTIWRDAEFVLTRDGRLVHPGDRA